MSVSRGSQGWFDANPSAPYFIGNTGGWITFAGFFLSFLIAWWPFASDYSRYLPDNDKVNRATGFWTFAGNFITLCWLGIAGALLGARQHPGRAPSRRCSDSPGPSGCAALMVVLISSFSQNFLNVYGGAISVQP